MSNNETSCVVQHPNPRSMDRRDFLRRGVIGMGASALALAAVKPALADTIITRDHVSVNGEKLAKTATCVVGKSGAGDFLTDDYASDDLAIQAAIDYVDGLNGGSILIREGQYLIDNVMNLYDGIVLAGVSSNYTTTSAELKLNADVGMFNIVGAHPDADRIRPIALSNLNMNGNSKAQICINAKYVDQFTMERCQVDLFTKNAFILEECWDWYINTSYIKRCGDGLTYPAIHLYNGALDNTNNIHFSQCRFENNTGVVIYSDITGASGQKNRNIFLVSCKFHGVTTIPVPNVHMIDGAISGLQIVGCYAIHGAKSFVNSISGSSGLKVHASQFENFDEGAFNINSTYFSVMGNHFVNTGVSQHITFGSSANNGIVSGNTKWDSATKDIANKPTLTKVFRIDNPGFNPVGNFTAPSVPATAVNYTNAYGYPCQVLISGGTVTEIDLDDIATGLTSGMFVIAPGETINITYSSAPTWKWWGL